MATVTPKIQPLNPSNSIKIVMSPGHMNGTSGTYTMPVKLSMVPASKIMDVHITLNIKNSNWYRFGDGSSSIDNEYKRLSNGAVINIDFQIKNIVPLQNVQLILFVYSSDLLTPANAGQAKSIYPVI